LLFRLVFGALLREASDGWAQRVGVMVLIVNTMK
jgi:hypothetical protein